MNLAILTESINKFNNTSVEDSRNKIESSKPYRGNQHDLDTFNNTIQYIEYKKNLRKNKKNIKIPQNNNVFDDMESLQEKLYNDQFKKNWSRLDVYSKKTKISEYMEELVKDKKIEEENVKNIIANIYRLLEQKKLNKKGNIEYDSENGKILSISKHILETDCI